MGGDNDFLADFILKGVGGLVFGDKIFVIAAAVGDFFLGDGAIFELMGDVLGLTCGSSMRKERSIIVKTSP